MGHLGEGTEITTVEDKEIVLTATNGQHFRMKIADLAEAMRQVMPEATSEQKGLAGRFTATYYPYHNKAFSLNDLVNNGYYYIDDDIVREGAPIGFSNYCVIVFNAGFPIQMLYDYQNRILFRIKWSKWSSWMKINFTTMK